MFAIFVPLALLYLIFWLWYGGNGQPMSSQEFEEALHKLRSTDSPRDKAETVCVINMALPGCGHSCSKHQDKLPAPRGYRSGSCMTTSETGGGCLKLLRR